MRSRAHLSHRQFHPRRCHWRCLSFNRQRTSPRPPPQRARADGFRLASRDSVRFLACRRSATATNALHPAEVRRREIRLPTRLMRSCRDVHGLIQGPLQSHLRGNRSTYLQSPHYPAGRVRRPRHRRDLIRSTSHHPVMFRIHQLLSVGAHQLRHRHSPRRANTTADHVKQSRLQPCSYRALLMVRTRVRTLR